MDIPKQDVKGYLSDFCDIFCLHNLINKKTCSKKDAGSSLDIFLTSHPKNFMKTSIIETGLSDFHKFVGSFLKSRFMKIPPKNIVYRSYKHFDEN